MSDHATDAEMTLIGRSISIDNVSHQITGVSVNDYTMLLTCKAHRTKAITIVLELATITRLYYELLRVWEETQDEIENGTSEAA